MGRPERRQFDSLLAWRKAIGLTQKEAANILGVSQPALSLWESGGAPSRLRAKRISEKTGVPIERLLRVA